MPQLFKVGPWRVYFWSNESNPLEPVHVHIAEGMPGPDATKVWITRSGKCIVANNTSRIPRGMLHSLLMQIEANSDWICDKWLERFGEITFYC